MHPDTAAAAPNTADARLFDIDGIRATLAELLAANADDPDLCEWAQTAKPGDVFGGGAGGSCECVEAGGDSAAAPTPGPWRRLGHRQIGVDGPDGLVVICEVLSGGTGIEQADANEDLIAGSKRLLRAAKGFVTHLQRVGIPNDDQSYIDELIAAIAAAEGRS